MIQLGVTELVEDEKVDKASDATGLPTTKRASDTSPAEPGTVSFLPCKVRLAALVLFTLHS